MHALRPIGVAGLRSLGLAGLLSLSALVLVPAGLAPSHAVAQHGDAGRHAEEEGGAAEGGHEGAEHDEHALEWNMTRLAGSGVNFLIWLGLVVFGLSKVVPGFLAKRRAGIVDGLEEARQLKEAAETKYAEYSERIDNLDSELDRLREEFKRAGLEERDRVVAAASARAERMHAEARFLVEQQMKQLREDLTREAIEAAVAAAEKILKERATAADQQRLADEYLSRLKGSIVQKTPSPKVGS